MSSRQEKVLALAVSLWIANGGTLWVPTAEAAEREITQAPASATDIQIDTENKRAYPENNNDTWKLNYTGSGTPWEGYNAYGRYNSKGGDEFTLVSGKINSAYGIYNANADATSGKVTISGGEVTTNVYGGFSDALNANNNTVTINAAINGNVTTVPTFSTGAIIYGGYSNNSGTTANNNTVNINAGVTVKGIFGGKGDTSTGNTLNLGATGITVGGEGVKNIQTIAITNNVPFTDGATVLSSTTGGIGTNSCNDVTLDVTGLTGKTTPGTADGAPIRAASIKGGSVLGEVGLHLSATETNPWEADLNIHGSCGQHRGVGGTMSVAYKF